MFLLWAKRIRETLTFDTAQEVAGFMLGRDTEEWRAFVYVPFPSSNVREIEDALSDAALILASTAQKVNPTK